MSPQEPACDAPHLAHRLVDALGWRELGAVPNQFGLVRSGDFWQKVTVAGFRLVAILLALLNSWQTGLTQSREKALRRQRRILR
ncbi:hypothetical protein MUY35_09060 [Aliiroseovarius sp. S1339]|uniref:hypothetical protein n=1 Tax=Aliiroseovarius sp. S1339 TaxID=2936990 RepID=UPI0020C0530E|nr:hypothetical protein [Aliiroseovarius sp. S1339]MCK8463997.1 hypothetical protein [Aliiroseovarius sp. S1339]